MLKPRMISNSAGIFTLLIAVFFWYFTFSLQLTNFWLSMSIAAVTLSVLSIYFGGKPFARKEISWRTVIAGVISAAVLYFIFGIGNTLSQLMFSFAKVQVDSVYTIRTEGHPLIISLILLLITSPGEEIFWRGFLQRWTTQLLGPVAGWLAAAAVYAGVHVFSGNFMLAMAALIAGLFWGYLYFRTKSIVPGIVSHALWTILIFVLFPMG